MDKEDALNIAVKYAYVVKSKGLTNRTLRTGVSIISLFRKINAGSVVEFHRTV